jgi:WD40 repeat protein/serine/threonine protein kinase
VAERMPDGTNSWEKTLTVGPGRVVSLPEKVAFRFVGDYELLEELARGGMGIVFKARQVSLKRTVALKMIHGGALASPQVIRRFHTEAEAAAKLDHPHIVPIYEIGQHEEHHYFTMKLLTGGSLADALSEQRGARLKFRSPARTREDQRAVAQFMKEVAQAVQYAHERGVLHRDLKPGNILLDGEGEPHVTDFSLAKLLEHDSGLTLTEAVLGSPGYMAPEQASGKSREVTTAADIYSLGVVLFELLTGQLPFHGETSVETMRAIVEQEPPRPRSMNPMVDPDLETICLKCLEKEPGRRYGTAKALEEDLDRYVRDQPIQARPVKPAERAWRWCRRNPVVASLEAALAFALLSGLIGVLVQWQRAQSRAREYRRLLYVRDIGLAYRALKEGDVRQAEALLSPHDLSPGAEDLRGFEWFTLKRLCGGDDWLSITNKFVPMSVAFSPDGKLLAIGSGNQNPGEGIGLPNPDRHRGELMLIDIVAGKTINAFQRPTAWVTAVAFSGDHQTLAAGGSDGTITLWNYVQGVTNRTLTAHAQGITSLSFSPDGGLLASGSTDRLLKLWNTTSWQGQSFTNQGGNPDSIDALAFSRDGKQIAFAGSGAQITVLDLVTRARTTVFEGNYIQGLAFAPDGRSLAAALATTFVQLIDLRTRPPTPLEIGQHQNPVTSVAFLRDGSRLISASEDHTLKLWDVQNRKELAVFRGHHDVVRQIAISPDGATVASASDDHTVKLWHTDPLPDADILPHSNWVWTVDFSPNGKQLVTGDWDGIMRLWDVGGNLVRKFQAHTGAAFRAIFSRDGNQVISSGQDRLIKIWDIRSAADLPVATLRGNEASVMSLCLSPDGKTLFSATGEPEEQAPGIIKVWDLPARKEIASVPVSGTGVQAMALSPDGRVLAAGSSDLPIKLWDVRGQRTLATLPETGVGSLAFSPDGRILASVSGARLIFWDVAEQKKLIGFEGTAVNITGLRFTSDGRSLIGGCGNGTVGFWNVATRQELLIVPGQHGFVGTPDISPDGRILASPCSDGTVRLWPARRFLEEVP